eukprot:TRINITY_DN840_c0_g2_i1.p2 TRINITY_DN840_c0_g2~~TRINITY_DN840_c0_g2_i1.p2  ORF type:complete len:111 (+),score=2.60 TRINITY_DN840_c0_g2_i1:127-459(+)
MCTGPRKDDPSSGMASSILAQKRVRNCDVIVLHGDAFAEDVDAIGIFINSLSKNLQLIQRTQISSKFRLSPRASSNAEASLSSSRHSVCVKFKANVKNSSFADSQFSHSR